MKKFKYTIYIILIIITLLMFTFYLLHYTNNIKKKESYLYYTLILHIQNNDTKNAKHYAKKIIQNKYTALYYNVACIYLYNNYLNYNTIKAFIYYNNIINKNHYSLTSLTLIS